MGRFQIQSLFSGFLFILNYQENAQIINRRVDDFLKVIYCRVNPQIEWYSGTNIDSAKSFSG